MSTAIKKIIATDGVSQILGSVLLLAIAIILFSYFAVNILSEAEQSPSPPNIRIMGHMDETKHAVIEHGGGDTIELNRIKIIIWKGEEESRIVYFTKNAIPINENGEIYTKIKCCGSTSNPRLNVGGYIDIDCAALFGDITNWEISVIIIDKLSSSRIMSGVLQQGILHMSPPIARFTYAPLHPKTQEIIEFNANQSYDPDGGTLITYKWDFDNDGTIDAYGKVVIHQYTSSGTYTITLTVVDDEGQQGEAITGTGTPGDGLNIPSSPNVTDNQLPIVHFNWSYDQNIDGTINFFADVKDPDGEIATFYWNFGDGNISSSKNPTHTYGRGGQYTISLIVMDDDGGQSSTELTITVPNISPTAGFSHNPANITTARTVTFDARLPYSFDKDGTITNWTWDFDDNGIIDNYGAIVSHIYSSPGNYRVIVNVTDNEGAWSLCQKDISVYPPRAASSPRFLFVDNTPIGWESGIDNLLASCQSMIPSCDYSWGKAIDQYTFVNDSEIGHGPPYYTSPDMWGKDITSVVLNDFDILIWSTGDFPGDGYGSVYDGNPNTWSTPMTEGSDDGSDHVSEIYQHLTGSTTAGTLLLTGTYNVWDIGPYTGSGGMPYSEWRLAGILGVRRCTSHHYSPTPSTSGVNHDYHYNEIFNYTPGNGSRPHWGPISASGSLIGFMNTSSGQRNIATIKITSPINMYALEKQSDVSVAYSLQNLNAHEDILLDRDMETNPNWIHGGINDIWEWGIPTPLPHAHSGSRVYGTNLDDNYPYNVDCYLETNPIDLTSYISAILEFYDWYELEDIADCVYLEISDDDGSSWSTLDVISGEQEYWGYHSYNISAYVGNVVWIRWCLVSDTVFNGAGYYLDDVTVTATASSVPSGHYAIDVERVANRSIILSFDLNADEITNKSRTHYLLNIIAWLAEGAGYYTELWVDNDPPEGWLEELNHVDTIQAAVNSVSPGGTVYVNGAKGQIYEENIVVNKSVRIVGLDKPIIRAGGAYIIKVEKDWTKIDGFNIEGVGVQNGIYIEDSSGCTIINCTVSNIVHGGIYVLNAHNNTIQDNIIHDTLYGIFAGWSSGNTLEDNTIYANERGIYLKQASLINMGNNTIYNNSDLGIYMESVEQSSIYCNSIFNNAGDGLGLMSSANKNEINGNNIQNNYHGIHLLMSNLNILLNNTIENNTESGIYSEDYSQSNTLRENRIFFNVYGIKLENSSSDGILYNLIAKNQYGVYFFSSSNNVLQNNTISDNINDGISFLSSSNRNVISSGIIHNNSCGIYISSSEHNAIEGNTISSNNAIGIYLDYSMFGFPAENSIISNTISYNNESGLYLYSSVGNVINKNEIYLNGKDGIRLFSSSNLNSITNNTITDNSYGIYLDGSSFNSVINNTINSCSQSGIYLNNYASRNDIYGNNTLEYNTNGVKLHVSNINNISNNTIRLNQAYGILLSSSHDNDIYSNRIDSNMHDGICVKSSDSNMIFKNAILNNLNGILLLSSGGTGNVLLNNTIYSNKKNGILLENSRVATAGNNEIIGNIIYSHDSGNGIYLLSSNINFITRNEIYSNNMSGIYLNSSLSNTIKRNELYNNELHGLYLNISNNNNIQSNKLSFNEGSGLYLFQSSGGSSLPILNNYIWNNSDAGIFLYSSNSNHVDFNTICNNSRGIVLDDSSCDNIIKYSILHDNSYGMFIADSSSDNVLKYNILHNNSYGVYITDSSTNNKIHDNNITGNACGAYIATSDCASNEIYHNNFMNNTLHDDSQAYDLANNSWYLGGLGGGNYWSDKLSEETYYAIPPYGIQDKYPLETKKQWWL